MRGLFTAAALAAALAAAIPAAAQPGGSCFRTSQWHGWKAADARTVFIHVGGNRVFRLDMSGACPALTLGDATLITRDLGGSGVVCSPLDLDLRVSLGGHITTACTVGGISELTPGQIDALPKRLRP